MVWLVHTRTSVGITPSLIAVAVAVRVRLAPRNSPPRSIDFFLRIFFSPRDPRLDFCQF